MKRYIIQYAADGETVERVFASKADAFRWFNRECPPGEAVFIEEEAGGQRSPAKTLRKKVRTRPASCGPASVFLRVPARRDQA